MAERPRDRLSAIHESAHAVLAARQGVAILSVDIDREIPVCRTAIPPGWQAYGELPGRYMPSNAEDPIQREAVLKRVRVLLAGAVMAAKFNELEPDDGDVLQATTLIASLGLQSEAEEEAYMALLMDETIMLVERHHAEIDLIADALMEQGKLSGVAVRKLMAERQLNLAETAYGELRPKPAT